MACIFCEIAEGKKDAHVVYENEGALAFLDISPLSGGHTLVIPRKHFVQAHEMDAESWDAVADAMREAAGLLVDKLGVEAYNILQNNGAAAHQAVMHVHFHIIPKTRSGGLELKYMAGQERPGGDIDVGKTYAKLKERGKPF